MTDDTKVRAIGIALATLEALLIAKGVLRPGELSERLDAMADVTGEADADTAEVLEDFAAMLAQVDAAQAGRP
jgi:hypothetical protein